MKKSLLYIIFTLIFASSNLVSGQETCKNVENDGECQQSNENNDSDEHSLSSEEQLILQAAAFGDFLVDIFDLNDAYQGTNRTEQEYLVLKAVLEHVGMNASLLTAPTISYNWYLRLVYATDCHGTTQLLFPHLRGKTNRF